MDIKKEAERLRSTLMDINGVASVGVTNTGIIVYLKMNSRQVKQKVFEVFERMAEDVPYSCKFV
jgi:hypothetical protein